MDAHETMVQSTFVHTQIHVEAFRVYTNTKQAITCMKKSNHPTDCAQTKICRYEGVQQHELIVSQSVEWYWQYV